MAQYAMAACCRSVPAGFQRTGYTGFRGVVQPRVRGGYSERLLHEPRGAIGQPESWSGAMHEYLGTAQCSGFQGYAAAWIVHGLQCRGLPSGHPLDEWQSRYI